MEKYTGIWLDHRKAIVFSFVGDIEHKHVILSGVQTRLRTPGEGKAYTRMGQAFIAPEHQQEERIRHQLNRYYEAINSYVQDATEILIFGPGEAKIELEKAMGQHPEMKGKIREVVAANRLTERQIAARVREFTAKQRLFRHPLNHPYNNS